MANDSNGSRATVISNCIKACTIAEPGKGAPSLDAAPKRAGPATKVVRGWPMSRLRP